MGETQPRSKGNFSAEQFFETQSPPAGLARVSQLASEFVAKQKESGRKVVLVTSGGTTVPLEQNVVRFLDNFSAGTRGATSAEYFLSAGYAVIFMHRQHSLSPYTRHYSHTTNPFLDLLEEPTMDSNSGELSIKVSSKYSGELSKVLKAYHNTQRAGTLLRLPFVTVNEYLFMLREMSKAMEPLGRSGMYYLAAAVSDFFVPSQKTPEHKIQSGKGSLTIEMDQVPKVLKPMVQQWAPEGFVVSFKLETDQNLLIPKARAALERYGHQVVIGNDLNRRKFEVVFVERKSESESRGTDRDPTDEERSGFSSTWMRLKDHKVEPGSSRQDASSETPRGKNGEREIEEDIVRELCKRHENWIRNGLEKI